MKYSNRLLGLLVLLPAILIIPGEALYEQYQEYKEVKTRGEQLDKDVEAYQLHLENI